ncbi:uncharacterized protein LOC111946946 isoform X3 [Oryzias latipes]
MAFGRNVWPNNRNMAVDTGVRGLRVGFHTDRGQTSKTLKSRVQSHLHLGILCHTYRTSHHCLTAHVLHNSSVLPCHSRRPQTSHSTSQLKCLQG